jgi:hypothetical protein
MTMTGRRAFGSTRRMGLLLTLPHSCRAAINLDNRPSFITPHLYLQHLHASPDGRSNSSSRHSDRRRTSQPTKAKTLLLPSVNSGGPHRSPVAPRRCATTYRSTRRSNSPVPHYAARPASDPQIRVRLLLMMTERAIGAGRVGVFRV